VSSLMMHLLDNPKASQKELDAIRKLLNQAKDKE
jgi:hypothetical protein